MSSFICLVFLSFIRIIISYNHESKQLLHRKDLNVYIDTPSFKSLPFPFGAAVKVKSLKDNSKYRNLLVSQFSRVTAENSMKFKNLHPLKDLYKWKDADYIVNFASQRGMLVHGHVLLWPRSNPQWVNNFQGDSVAWEGLLKSHIQTVVKHFKGKVASWDVVNEAINNNGTLEKNIWLTKLGKGYIARSFQYAHQADPNALLFYNDYGHEYSKIKLKAIVKLAIDLKNSGIPIDGLGLQMHTRIGRPERDIKRAITTAASTGLMIHLSELDVSVSHGKPLTFTLDSLLLLEQAEKYKQIVSAYNKSVPKKQQFGITTWNVSDVNSWKNSKVKNHDFPLIFDYNYKPKPAFWSILSVFGNHQTFN